MNRIRRWILPAGIALLFFVLPMLLVQLTAPPPRTRRIHLDLFRYGSQPEVLHVTRGDTLIFTFDSRDTPHSFFLEEYDLDVKVTPNTGEVEVAHPSDPHGEPEHMREVIIRAGRSGLMGFFNTKSRFRCHVYCGEMHAFEQGFFVVHPNYLHAGATGLLCAIPLIGLLRVRRRGKRAGEERTEKQKGIDLLARWPWLSRFLAIPGLQYWLMTVMSLLLYVILVTSLVGTKMAGGNLGVMLLWVVWLFFLIALFVPFAGRIWCTICPLPMFGDALQRGTTTGIRTGGSESRYQSRFSGLMRPWPTALSNLVPRTVVFLCFATVSILILSQPRWTGWALIILLALATLLPLIFELRAFCRYLCPINSFISLYARISPLGLRARKKTVCEQCLAKGIESCRWGDEHGWACPYGLTVSQIDDNAECGLCFECLRSCRFRNTSLFWRPFGLEKLLERRDEALQAIVMLTLGILYCITFQGPWHALHDMVNIVDKGNWHLFAVYSATLWLIALGLAPLLVYLATALGRRAAGLGGRTGDLYARNASPLVPMGLCVWIGFVIPPVLVNGSFILSTLSDPFGWGWNLFGTAGQPWQQLWPESIPWIQASCALVGFAIALRTAHRVWSRGASEPRQVILGMLPMSAMLFVLTGGLIWFFTG